MKLPAKIFVKWDSIGDDVDLVVAKTKYELAEKGEVVTIGEYTLVRSSKVTLKPVETDPENHP